MRPHKKNKQITQTETNFRLKKKAYKEERAEVF